MTLDLCLTIGDIGPPARRKDELDRVIQGIDGNVDLDRSPPRLRSNARSDWLPLPSLFLGAPAASGCYS
jgi:hypothetical protein